MIQILGDGRHSGYIINLGRDPSNLALTRFEGVKHYILRAQNELGWVSLGVILLTWDAIPPIRASYVPTAHSNIVVQRKQCHYLSPSAYGVSYLGDGIIQELRRAHIYPNTSNIHYETHPTSI